MSLPKCITDRLPAYCNCGNPLEVAGPYLDEKLFGLYTKPCDACGLPGVQITTYRDTVEMKRVAAIILGLENPAPSSEGGEPS